MNYYFIYLYNSVASMTHVEGTWSPRTQHLPMHVMVPDRQVMNYR